MRTKFKQSVFWIPIVLSMVLTGCKREITTTTRIHPDGSCERTVILRGDSSSVFSGSFPVPRDSTWEVTKKVEKETQRGKKGEKSSDKKLVYTARKTFPNVRSLDTELAQKQDSVLVVRISASLNKRFRWFNTFYIYQEVYKASTPFQGVPITDYMKPKELELYYQLADTLKNDTLHFDKKIDAWLERGHFEDYFQVLVHEAEAIKDPNLTLQRIVSLKDSLFRAARHFDEANDNKSFLQFTEAFFKTKSVRKMSKALERAEKDAEQKQEFVMQMADDDYSNQIVMPGVILDTNAQTVDGNMAIWKFGGRQFLWTDYEMRVESRVVNRWAVYVTAGLLLVVLAGIAVSVFRR